MLRKILLLSVLSIKILLFSVAALAQTDTEFWFAAPEVSIASAQFDRPIYLRISSLQQSSIVTISQPANPSFNPIVVDIAAGITRTVDLTKFIDNIENKPANTVLNYGLLIKATHPVSVYYEVASTNCFCNPEIFTLKGKNALGTLFYTPFQNVWDNSIQVTYSPTPVSSFDIIATEDNTTISIVPKNSIVGHSANASFSIILDKGQTYSAVATSQQASQHLSGSKISSDKPIAVTIKDDLLYNTISGIDLMGDQIVPITIIGNEYIVTKGLLNEAEKVFILATQSKTAIYINGNTIPVATINTGETYTLTVSNQHTYIKANQPIYVLHASGNELELGGALLPKLECNGSRQIGFTRSTNETCALNLVVKKGGEAGFTLNGNPNAIPANTFLPVPGTNGDWLAAQIKYNTTLIPVGTASLIQNTVSNFQMGLINGGAGGASYGYFSNFSSLNLGNDLTICSTPVILDAGPDKTSYLWSDGSKNQTLTVTQAGKYWVKTAVDNCILMDTITVIDGLPKVNLGDDIILCKNQPISIILQATTPEATYLWQDGSKKSSFEAKSAGTYWVEVTNSCGTVKDEMIVFSEDLPEVNLGSDTTLCTHQTLLLDATVSGATYLWQDNSTKATLSVIEEGIYWVDVKIGSCQKRDSIQVKFGDCAESIYIPNVFTPNGDEINETFFIKGIKPGTWQLEIYSRWGEQVFKSKSYYNDWNAHNLNHGLYFYFLYNPYIGSSYKGWVHVLK